MPDVWLPAWQSCSLESPRPPVKTIALSPRRIHTAVVPVGALELGLTPRRFFMSQQAM